MFVSEISFSQNQNRVIDSLIQVLTTAKEDTVKVNLLNKLCNIEYEIANYDNSLSYAKGALSLAEKLGFSRGMNNAYNALGVVYTMQSNYPEALKNLFSSLRIAEETGDKQGVSIAYGNIGNVDNQMSNYSEALSHFSASLSIAQEIGDKEIMLVSYNNIGIIHEKQGNYDEALKNYLTSLSIAKEQNDRRNMANAYLNIGVVYIHQVNYPKAQKNYLTALKIYEELEDKSGASISYLNLGELSMMNKEYNESMIYLSKALMLSKETGSRDLIRDSYLGLSQLDSARDNYKVAYQYYKLYAEMKDSILNEESNKQISKLKIQYETEKKEKENLTLTKNNEIKTIRIERQRTIILYLAGAFILMIAFVLIYFRLYKLRSKSIFRQQVLETEMKALRSQMNPHFTFNVLNSIQYFVSENDMESAELYLEKFSSLIRLILDQSRTAYVALEQEVNMLKLYLELEEMRFEKKFTYSIVVDNNIDPRKVLIPGILIQPIVENAIKHGIEHKDGNAVIDILFSMNNSILLCSVTDNGIGRAAAEKFKIPDVHKSMATTITQERIDTLSSIYNIKLTYKTEDLYSGDGKPAGTSVKIEIPIGIQNEELVTLIG